MLGGGRVLSLVSLVCSCSSSALLGWWCGYGSVPTPWVQKKIIALCIVDPRLKKRASFLSSTSFSQSTHGQVLSSPQGHEH
jgi:hypothetical protein